MTRQENGAAREVTRILRMGRGRSREEVLGELAPIVYEELKRLAGAQLREEHPDHSLQATALVNEAYLRLVEARNPPSHDFASWGGA